MIVKIRQYQQGGGLMASIYQPVINTPGATGGYSTAQTAISLLNGSTSGTSGKSSNNGEITEKDLYAGLYKTIAEQGLLNDTQYIIKQLQTDLFNDQLLDPFGDSSSLSNQYLKALSYVNMAKSNQKLYDDTYKQAASNGSLQEAAVTSNGGVVVKKDGKLEIITPEQYKKDPSSYTLMTNGNLLAERMNNPEQAFKNELLAIVQGGTSMKEISEVIDQYTKNLGSQDSLTEKYTDDATVQQGIHELKQLVKTNGAEKVISSLQNGQLYKIGVESKSNAQNILIALDSIYNALNQPQRTLLELHGGKAALAGLLAIQSKDSFKFTIDAQKEKSSSSSSSTSGGGKGEAELNYAEVLLHGSNEPELVQFGVKNSVYSALGRHSRITNYQGESLGTDFSFNELYKSQVGAVLNKDQASFGDIPINKAFKDRIIVTNDDIVGVDLPYKTLSDGRIVPNFELLSKVREIDNTILQQGLSPNNPSDISKINKLYTDAKLPIKYSLDSKGQIHLTGNYKRFAAIQAMADEQALMGGYQISNPTLEVVEDENEQEDYIRKVQEITKNKDYDLDKPGWFKFGDRHIVKGTIFIPITGSAIDARMASSKGKVTGGTTDYDTLRGVDYAKNNYVVPEQVNLTQ